MAREKSISNYLRAQGIQPQHAECVQHVLQQWREARIPLWSEDNKRDEQRTAVILGRALSCGEVVRFFAPVCPDYPKNRGEQLGEGLGATIPPVLAFMRAITGLLEEYLIPYNFQVLLADTEIDLPEIVALLADSQEDFVRRCTRTVETAQQENTNLFTTSVTHCGSRSITTFSEFFGEAWRAMQCCWEEVVRVKLQHDGHFRIFLSEVVMHRTEKYEGQIGRRLAGEECMRFAVRHYAQYHTLGYWMRQYPGVILVNTDSPNLRAIRHPFIILPEQHPVSLDVRDQHMRIPIIVP